MTIAELDFYIIINNLMGILYCYNSNIYFNQIILRYAVEFFVTAVDKKEHMKLGY